MKFQDYFKDQFDYKNPTNLLKIVCDVDVASDLTTDTAVTPNSIIVADQMAPFEIFKTLHRYGGDHVIQPNKKYFLLEALTSGLLIRQPEYFLENFKTALLTNFFHEPDFEKQLRQTEFTISKSAQKNALIKEIGDFVEFGKKRAIIAPVRS